MQPHRQRNMPGTAWIMPRRFPASQVVDIHDVRGMPDSLQPAANGCATLAFFDTTSAAVGCPATARWIASRVAL